MDCRKGVSERSRYVLSPLPKYILANHPAADGFITSPAGHWKLQQSPVKFLKELITVVRRDCEAIDRTHIGKILDGALVEERDFE